jgi:hypothetical protein
VSIDESPNESSSSSSYKKVQNCICDTRESFDLEEGVTGDGRFSFKSSLPLSQYSLLSIHIPRCHILRLLVLVWRLQQSYGWDGCRGSASGNINIVATTG